MKYLVVGLGNIGDEYQGTRHNIGFRVLDALVEASNLVFKNERYGSVAQYSLKGRKVILLEPNTYMNLSGKAVRYWMQAESIPLDNVLIVVDDIALPFGKLRLKGKGSSAGHNGLKNIEEMVGSQSYARLRFGTGNDFQRGHQADYVLEQFPDEQAQQLPAFVNTAVEIIQSFILSGIDITMNKYNNK